MIVRFIARVLFKLLFRFQVSGQKNVPEKGGVILACNHISYLDPPALGAASPRVVSFMAKEELFRIAIFGGFIRRLNAVPLKTHSGDIGTLRWALRELQAGGVVTIFPEGERTADGQLGKPLKGVGLLAVKSGAPIVPAFIEGSNRALPLRAKFIRLKKVRLYFGRPFYSGEVSGQLKREDLYQAIAERTMAEIKRLKERKR